MIGSGLETVRDEAIEGQNAPTRCTFGCQIGPFADTGDAGNVEMYPGHVDLHETFQELRGRRCAVNGTESWSGRPVPPEL